MRFTIYQQSAIGSRKANQDRIGYSYSKSALIMIVADGMGGHAQGEVAAEIAVETITRKFQQDARPRIREPEVFLEDCLTAAHRAIVSYAVERNLLECPRTTCVVSLVQAGRAWWAHSGDSRLFFMREGRLEGQTFDHSRVQQMIDMGQISHEAAAVHPDRNKVYSCLGGVLPPTITVGGNVNLARHDTLLLCTDGFWSQIPGGMLAALVAKKEILSLIPELILTAEREADGQSDNISVVAMTWEEQIDDPLASPLDGFTTQTTTQLLSRTQPMQIVDDISDEDIEKAIAEIQDAIKKVAK